MEEKVSYEYILEFQHPDSDTWYEVKRSPVSKYKVITSYENSPHCPFRGGINGAKKESGTKFRVKKMKLTHSLESIEEL